MRHFQTTGSLSWGVSRAGQRIRGGGSWDWLTPFAALTALSLAVGYATLGATWLILKTDGATLARTQRFACPLGAALVVLIGVVSLATPFLRPEYLDR